MQSRLHKLAAWHARLGPGGRSVWRGGVRGATTFAILLALWLFSLAAGEDHSPLLVLGWGGWIACSVGVVGALEERWGEAAPWRTTLLCTAVAWFASLGAIGQWGYMRGVSHSQLEGWESALHAPLAVPLEVWLGLAAACQLLGAVVLLRRKKPIAALFYANVAVSMVMIPVGLFIVFAFEDFVAATLEEAAPPPSPDPILEQGPSG